MFFVSRVDEMHSRMWVVDTDDGIENCMEYQRVIDAIVNKGFKVKGVSLRQFTGSSEWYVYEAKPYQHHDTKTPLQLKTQMLCGVDIVVYNGMVTCVEITGKVKVPAPIIRLSDFSNKLCGNILNWCRDFKGHRLTIILDDKLKSWSYLNFYIMSRRMFGVTEGGWVKGLGIKLDVREVRDDSKVYDLYRMAFDSINDISVLDKSFIDREERKSKVLTLLL